MPLFKTQREKRLWLYTFFVLAAIVLTLVFSRPIIEKFGSQEFQAALFLFCMFLIGCSVLLHGLITKPGKAEIAVWLGLAAVYLLLFLRLGHAERSHMMEFSVLAIFIHRAFNERFSRENKMLKPALYAFLATLAIGVLDEVVQKFIPNRVFDPIDILFNSLAALLAILSSLALQWVRRKIGHKPH